jgi:hypothetical protein
MTMAEMWEKRGSFLNVSDGTVVAEPEGWFPIVCGGWPNANVGARQARCSKCDEFIGISPKGWAKHLEKPEERPLFCAGCLDILRAMLMEMEGARHPGT